LLIVQCGHPAEQSAPASEVLNMHMCWLNCHVGPFHRPTSSWRS
jgi:hypothetical protein